MTTFTSMDFACYIANSSSLLLEENPLDINDLNLTIYQMKGVKGATGVAVVHQGRGGSMAAKSILGLARRAHGASIGPSVVAVWEDDACYTVNGRPLPYREIIVATLGNFSALIIAANDLSNCSVIKRGPDPEPWIVDWSCPHGNPVKSLITSGIIHGINPEKEYHEYISKLKNKPMTVEKHQAWLRSASRAMPMVIEKKLW